MFTFHELADMFDGNSEDFTRLARSPDDPQGITT
jgi:hypothetical protein